MFLRKKIISLLIRLNLLKLVKAVHLFCLTFHAIIIANFNKKFRNNIPCDFNSKRCSDSTKSEHYHYHLWGGDTPVCCATHLYELLNDIVKVLEANNIEYFVNYGTFLGIVRHGGIIPWDTDVDLGIFRIDKKRISNIISKNLSKKYKIVDKSDYFLRVYYGQNNNLHLDFDIWDVDDDIMRFDSDLLNGSIEFKRNEIFPLKRYKFYDIKVWGPKDKYFLKCAYGEDFMEKGYKKWGLRNKKKDILVFKPAIINKDYMRNDVN